MAASGSNQLPVGFEELESFDLLELGEYKQCFENGGMSGVKKKIDKDINKWMAVPVNIAVTGNSGVGKSSFINTFRGLKPGDEGAAAVDVDETTMEPAKYMHPDNENIALWDLPGIGTPNFPQKTYVEEVNFQRYDYFLIITASRFTENDLWLANEILRLKKKFFFIRTKLEYDVLNDKRDHPSVSKEDTVKKVRKAMKSHVEKGGFQGVHVFLIDNRFYMDFDFPDLTKTMIESVPKWKQEALILTLTTLTEDVIYKKKTAMLKRIMFVSLGSAAGALVPIPGVGLSVDSGIIMSECRFYRKQFGLDDESLQKDAASLGISVDRLLTRSNIRTHLLGSSLASIAAYTSLGGASEFAEDVIEIVLPLIGSAIAASISYGTTVYVLKSILDEIVKDALQINSLLVEKCQCRSSS